MTGLEGVGVLELAGGVGVAFAQSSLPTSAQTSSGSNVMTTGCAPVRTAWIDGSTATSVRCSGPPNAWRRWFEGQVGAPLSLSRRGGSREPSFEELTAVAQHRQLRSQLEPLPG
jgi:hypothetical protein